MPRYASIDDVIASYPDRFNAEKAAGLHETVFMDLGGAEPRQIALVVDDGTLDVQQGVSPDDPSLTLTADAETWLAVENGEINPMMAMMTRKIKMKGNPQFAMKFMGLFGFAG